MDLISIRAKFIELSGRYDLVKGDGTTDNGADFYINAGQRLLDSIVDSPKTELWYIPSSPITSGDFRVVIPYCRSISRLWVVDADKRYELERKSLDWIRANYSYPADSSDYATPAYYAYAPVGLAPSLAFTKTDANYSGTIYDYQHVMFGDHFKYTGVILTPIADADYTLQVLGRFESQPLESVAYDSTRADSTTYTVGDKVKWSTGDSVWMATSISGTGETDSSAPSITGLGIGDTVTDNEVTWTMLSLTGVTSSYWSEVYPEVLVKASLAELESFYRNTEGYRDYKEAIREQITGIDEDLALLENDSFAQMDSSWRM